MHGVTSTGNNAENRSTSGEGSSTGTTQGQTQGGRSVQQQTSVQPTLQSFCSAMSAHSSVTLFCNGSNINYNDSNTRHIPASNWRRCNGISTATEKAMCTKISVRITLPGSKGYVHWCRGMVDGCQSNTRHIPASDWRRCNGISTATEKAMCTKTSARITLLGSKGYVHSCREMVDACQSCQKAGRI